MICYSSYQDKDTETNSQLVNSNIYVVNSDGTGKRRLTKELDLEDYSSWSPDGSKIAFIHEKAEDDGGASLNVYVMNTDGSNWVQLTKDVNIWLDDFHLSWSPDGTKIIFNGSVADAVQGAIEGLFCVNLKDKSLKFITKEAGIYPSWSPDGTKIMFSAGDNNNKTSIYVMDADGSNFTMINVPIEPRYPVWISP
jgi:Tol biopolymer transport system component